MTNLISDSDQAALSWFFGPGLALYERSTFGAVLEKLAKESAFSTPCRTCSGEGILPSGSWCNGCNGTGSTPVEAAKLRRTPCSVCSAPFDGSGKRRQRLRRANCKNCLGSGEEPVSAAPIHKASSASGVEANETAMAYFATISRRVQRVRDVSPLLANVLAAWYGDHGEAREEESLPRHDLLYPFSEEGREYLLAVEDQHTTDLSELQDRANERSAELIVAAASIWNRDS